MADELARLRAALAARMQQIGAAPDDPRMAPLVAQMQALMQQRHSASEDARERAYGATGADNVASLFAPTHAATRDHNGGQAGTAALAARPPQLQQLVQAYVQAVRAGRPQAAGVLGAGAFFIQAPALAESDAGRSLLQLAPADKATVVVATYAAWTSERYGGS